MHTIDLYRWVITDRKSGRRSTTRYRMTREDALATDPHAEAVPGSLEQRRVPDGVAEHQHTSAQRGGVSES